MNIIYTVCNRTNLAHALALADSAFEFQPDHTFVLCWADSIPLKDLPGYIHLMSLSEVGILHWEEMASRYYNFELLSASRPAFALGLLKRYPDCAQITFLAPTVLLFHSFQDILTTDSDLFLTPNLTKPLPASGILDDKRILNAGMFHAGSWVLRPNAKTLKLLRWWANRTVDRASFNLCEGMNMDQLWLNYLPIWNKETTIIRHAGWHHGLQSVLSSKISKENERHIVEATDLITVDFAGLDFFDPVWSDHAALLSKDPVFKDLFKKYRQSVQHYAAKVPVGATPRYGKNIQIKKYRLFRNNIAKKLKTLTTYIDQF
ncbi:hypothetical protein [Dyadobacter sp. CY323]|uniref:hypothetical protein n=1 Tax=Dyadobacter sp. CY323 TaxID=2907302 RepID=UPI001F25A70D|nr:hypothetical protein [Dyadobacter sp. CY323]MCE6990284.1 hypothetical protein [Dyadobacter sp. CY323]